MLTPDQGSSPFTRRVHQSAVDLLHQQSTRDHNFPSVVVALAIALRLLPGD
jgi:hypothetical protein